MYTAGGRGTAARGSVVPGTTWPASTLITSKACAGPAKYPEDPDNRMSRQTHSEIALAGSVSRDGNRAHLGCTSG